jgi:RNA polymerase sigma factor (sigma-70 family)
MTEIKNAQNPPSSEADVRVKDNNGCASLREALKKLSYRHREIIRLRYGIEGDYVYTEEEVGHIFKITPENIHQVETEAIEKLCKITNLTTEQIENVLASHAQTINERI